MPTIYSSATAMPATGATVFQLDTMRSQRSIPTLTDGSLLMPTISDGLAMSVAATSFLVEYAVAMASFHHAMLLSASYRSSSPANTPDASQVW